MRQKLFAGLCSLFILAACSGGQNTANTTSSTAPQTSDPNAVQVYVEALNEPFIVQRPGNRMGGFEYDLLQAIAEKQGLRLEYHPVVWEELFAAIESGKANVIASNITVTEERKAKVDFTEPHLQSTTAVLLDKDTHAQSFAELNKPELVINVQTGTMSEEIAKRLWPQVKLTHEPNSFTQVNALLTGTANAAVGDRYVLSYYAQGKNQQGLHLLVDEKQEAEDIAFAVRKGQPELLKQLNDGLAAIRADGTYERIIQKWFGQAAADAAATDSPPASAAH